MASQPFPLVTLQIFVGYDLFSSHINWEQYAQLLSVIYFINIRLVPTMSSVKMSTCPSCSSGSARGGRILYPKPTPNKCLSWGGGSGGGLPWAIRKCLQITLCGSGDLPNAVGTIVTLT